ncbi:MAG: hypothetical protein JSV43_01330 [Methanobacteriota archaeon]|nr:MAG: hypothetical protein JSV43_01330 [Euryarchaeota archaeon]
MKNNKAFVTFIVSLFLGSTLTGLSGFVGEVEGAAGDWVEDIVSQLGVSMDAVVIGDADNDGKNEVVVGDDGGMINVRMYKYSSGMWVREDIDSHPENVMSVAIGDADNDGNNEIVIGLWNGTAEVRAYEKSGGIWFEEIITDTPEGVWSVAIGDADNDGGNDVVVGLDSTTNETRMYEKVGPIWVEENITDVPGAVQSVAIGDADNDGFNEVVIGIDDTSTQVRTYQKSGGTWAEDIIFDNPSPAWSVAIGDADNDALNEVVVGIGLLANGVWVIENVSGAWQDENIGGSTTWSVAIGDADNDGKNEIVTNWRIMYEKSGLFWSLEDYIADDVQTAWAVAIGDAMNHGMNGVIAGMMNPPDGLRIYHYMPGQLVFTSHRDGEYVNGVICLEVAVTSRYLEGVRFYVNSVFTHHDDSPPYQLIMDTTLLTEDAVYSIRAERYDKPSINDTIGLVVNNIIDIGDYITASTLEAEYQPDEMVSVIVGTKTPPVYDSLNLLVGYVDPGGNSYYESRESLPPGTQFIVGLRLSSDAALGTYLVSVDAYGFNNNALIWSATNSTSFNVSGKGIQEQFEDINTTLSQIEFNWTDINDMLIDIQNDLDSMNSTLIDLRNNIDYLNMTVPAKIDALSLELSAVNTSLTSIVTNAETNILAYIANINASLSSDIQNLLTSITNDVADMNSSLSSQLTNLLNSMTTSNDALRTWLEAVIGQIDANLTTASNTLQTQLTNLDASMTSFYNSLQGDIAGVLVALQSHDTTTGQNHSDIKDALDTLLAGGIGGAEILEVKNMLINLSNDLSDHNQSIADDVMGIVGSIDTFQADTGQRLQDINQTLDELAKLDEILADLDALSQALTSGLEQPNEEEMSKIDMNTILLIVILILVIVSIIANLISRRGSAEEEWEEEEEYEEGEEDEEVEEEE